MREGLRKCRGGIKARVMSDNGRWHAKYIENYGKREKDEWWWSIESADKKWRVVIREYQHKNSFRSDNLYSQSKWWEMTREINWPMNFDEWRRAVTAVREGWRATSSAEECWQVMEGHDHPRIKLVMDNDGRWAANYKKIIRKWIVIRGDGSWRRMMSDDY